MVLAFDTIAEMLGRHQTEQLPADERTRASVAIILRQGRYDLEMLFIERAAHERDPWSGNLAFPGGKVEPGEDLRAAAERETVEEIGFDLGSARYLGRLTDIGGAHLPVRVSCYVYGMQMLDSVPVLSNEVNDLFWVEFDDLLAVERRITAPVRFDDQVLDVPAIRLPLPGKPVLWGLTYRLTMQFLEIIAADAGGCILPDVS